MSRDLRLVWRGLRQGGLCEANLNECLTVLSGMVVLEMYIEVAGASFGTILDWTVVALLLVILRIPGEMLKNGLGLLGRQSVGLGINQFLKGRGCGGGGR